MVLFELNRSPTGLEIRLSFPCQSNLLDIMKLNLKKSFVFHVGDFPGDNMNQIQTYKLDIGVFQSTLLSFCVTLTLVFLSKIIRTLICWIFP